VLLPQARNQTLQNAASRAQSASSHMVAKIVSSIRRRGIQRNIEDVLKEYQFWFWRGKGPRHSIRIL